MLNERQKRIHRPCLGPVIALLLLLAVPATTSARERCCFRVQAQASGTLIANYDAAKRPDGWRVEEATQGRWTMEWSWTTREIAEYSESDDRRRLPFLRTGPIGKRNLQSPSKLRFLYREESTECVWERPRDTNEDGQPDAQDCAFGWRAQNECDPIFTITTNGRFVPMPVQQLVDFTSVDFAGTIRKALTTEVSPATHQPPKPGEASYLGRRCPPGAGAYGNVDHDYIAPNFDGRNTVFDRQGSIDAGTLNEGGPFYHELLVPPPSRRDFRQGKRFRATAGPLSLQENHGFEVFDPERNEWNRHTMSATGRVEISFVYFPARNLRKELRKLRRLQ
jgi:hypothetical protein